MPDAGAVSGANGAELRPKDRGVRAAVEPAGHEEQAVDERAELALHGLHATPHALTFRAAGAGHVLTRNGPHVILTLYSAVTCSFDWNSSHWHGVPAAAMFSAA